MGRSRRGTSPSSRADGQGEERRVSSDIAPAVDETTDQAATPEPTPLEDDGASAEGAVVLQFRGARADDLPTRVDEDTVPISPAGTGFALLGTPTGRRVRARLARFNAPWQGPQVSE